MAEREWKPGDPAILPPLPESAYPPGATPLDPPIYAPGSVIPAELRRPVAEGTATRSPNPLAGRHAYKVLQAIHHDGARVRPGEIVVLSPTSGLARSPFVRLIEDEPPPPEIAAALAEAENG